MEFIHIADLHANRERKEQCLEVLKQVKDYISSKQSHPILLISGDFWDSVITNTEAFADYINALKQIIQITSVYMIYGTASHEPDHSLSVFEELGAHVYRNPQYAITEDNFELIAIPEPRRIDYARYTDQDKVINERINKFISDIPAKNEMPRIVMYHGEIVGSVMQNGEVCSSKLAISPAALKTLKADYYACGHIHQPQEVFTNCYYSGSCYPVNYGEHHDASFNSIEISDKDTKVEIHSFGFPKNITEEISFSQIDEIKNKDYSNNKVHIKLTLDKLLKKTFNTEELRKEIKESTGAYDVKISFNYITTSNLRSEKISSSNSVIDKFKIYADINDIKYKDTLINKIQNIDENMLIEQFVPNDVFELEYISLRGAIGIKDGTGKDEINIDFTEYTDGVLGLVGPNGIGKTTLIENCHPYPQMLTRSGSLKDHFCLKDSHRILIYKTSTKEYKISMLIDGAAKCIGTKYIVEERKLGDETWTSVSSCNGSNDSYKEWVLHTFGSLDMFLRTSFYAKEQIKSVPDLSRATKGEKMTFFSTLAGTDYLSIISEEAKKRIKSEEEAMKDIKGSLKDYDQIKKNIEETQFTIDNNKSEIEKLNALISVDNKELEIYKEEQNKYLAVAGSLMLLKDNIKSKSQLEEELTKQLMLKKDEANNLQELVANKEDYKAQLQWYEENLAKRDDLKKEVSKKQDSIFDKKCKFNEAENIVLKLNKEKLEEERKINKYEVQIESLSRSIPDINGTCPVCGAPLSDHKKEELQKEILDIKKTIKTYTTSKEESLTKFAEIENKIKILNLDNLRDEIRETENAIYEMNNDIETINQYMTQLDLEHIKYVVEKAETDLQKCLFDKKELEVKVKNARDELQELKELNKNQPVDYSDKIKRLERGILDSSTKVGELSAELRICQSNMDKLNLYKSQIQDIESKLNEHQLNIKEYTIIEKAFGNNGIQALELDSAAPEISDITNSILRETYGDRFTLSFETQRDTTDGRRIDDFIINVFDAKAGRLKPLDYLCSGESVWIKQALYYAFSVLRTRRTGFCFKTRFLDEADGSLDSESRIKYVKMINTAHKACNAKLTLMITHSQEVKDILEQKLELLA